MTLYELNMHACYDPERGVVKMSPAEARAYIKKRRAEIEQEKMDGLRPW